MTASGDDLLIANRNGRIIITLSPSAAASAAAAAGWISEMTPGATGLGT